MIAHSFHGHPSFGPAGGLHGATYTVDVEFASRELHPECNWVIDIGIASDLVAEVLRKYNHKNLDEIFGDGVMTTTEFMCRAIFDGVVEKLKGTKGAEGDHNGGGFDGWIKVTLWESHKAWASFEGPLI
jgi:6-pyruvoyltetrahydropterin/6-carboxytetrahydropterin synthase